MTAADAPPGAGARGRGPATHPGGAPGRAAVGHLPTAGQPVPRPGLLGRRAAGRDAGPPARRLAADRAAAPLVRGGHRRQHVVHAAAPAVRRAHRPGPGADAAPGADGGGRAGRAPDVPARRRAGPRQDGAGTAGGQRRVGVPAARRGAQRRQDELGAGGGDVDAEPSRDRRAQRRRHDRRVLRHRHRQLRHPQPARRLARHVRLPRDGHRRGALHQEQDLAAVQERPRAVAPGPAAHRTPAAHGADRNPADQRHRGLPGDLGVPRLDRGRQARTGAAAVARTQRPHTDRAGLLPSCALERHRHGDRPTPQGGGRLGHPGQADRRHAGGARPAPTPSRSATRNVDSSSGWSSAIRARWPYVVAAALPRTAVPTASTTSWSGGSRPASCARPRRRAPARTSSA